MRLLADAQLPQVREFFPDFDVTTYTQLSPERLRACDVLITRSNVKLDGALLHNTPIQVVASPVSGRDHFDVDWLNEQAIHWYHAPGCNANAVMGYVLSAMAKTLPSPTQQLKIGVVGVGHIGGRLVKLLRQLGYQVVCHDPPRAEVDSNFISSELSDLTDCDVISLHTPLTKSGPHPTNRLITAEWLQALKHGATLINTSRGQVLHTDAAIEASKRINIIADVFEDEPSPRQDFIEAILLATPHIAGHTLEGKLRGIADIQTKIYQHFSLKIPDNQPLTLRQCPLSQLHWPEKVLHHYDPSQDRLLTAGAFAAQRKLTPLRQECAFYSC